MQRNDCWLHGESHSLEKKGRERGELKEYQWMACNQIARTTERDAYKRLEMSNKGASVGAASSWTSTL